MKLKEFYSKGEIFLNLLEESKKGLVDIVDIFQQPAAISGPLILEDEMIEMLYCFSLSYSCNFVPNGMPGIGLSVGDIVNYDNTKHLTCHMLLSNTIQFLAYRLLQDDLRDKLSLRSRVISNGERMIIEIPTNSFSVSWIQFPYPELEKLVPDEEALFFFAGHAGKSNVLDGTVGKGGEPETPIFFNMPEKIVALAKNLVDKNMPKEAAPIFTPDMEEMEMMKSAASYNKKILNLLDGNRELLDSLHEEIIGLQIDMTGDSCLIRPVVSRTNYGSGPEITNYNPIEKKMGDMWIRFGDSYAKAKEFFSLSKNQS